MNHGSFSTYLTSVHLNSMIPDDRAPPPPPRPAYPLPPFPRNITNGKFGGLIGFLIRMNVKV